MKQELYAQLKANVECLKAGKPPKHKGVDIHDEMGSTANPQILQAEKWRCWQCDAPATGTSKALVTGISEGGNSAGCSNVLPAGAVFLKSLVPSLPACSTSCNDKNMELVSARCAALSQAEVDEQVRPLGNPADTKMGPVGTRPGYDQCGNTSCTNAHVTREYKKCARCRQIKYCSPECQRAHWQQTHKFQCTPTPSPTTTREDTPEAREAAERMAALLMAEEEEDLAKAAGTPTQEVSGGDRRCAHKCERLLTERVRGVS